MRYILLGAAIAFFTTACLAVLAGKTIDAAIYALASVTAFGFYAILFKLDAE